LLSLALSFALLHFSTLLCSGIDPHGNPNVQAVVVLSSVSHGCKNAVAALHIAKALGCTTNCCPYCLNPEHNPNVVRRDNPKILKPDIELYLNLVRRDNP